MLPCLLQFKWIVRSQRDLEKAKEEFRTVAQKNGGTGVKILWMVCLGMLAEQVKLFLKILAYCLRVIVPMFKLLL